MPLGRAVAAPSRCILALGIQRIDLLLVLDNRVKELLYRLLRLDSLHLLK